MPHMPKMDMKAPHLPSPVAMLPSGGAPWGGGDDGDDQEKLTCYESVFGKKEPKPLPANFCEYIAYSWAEFAHDSDVFSALFATEKEIERYGYLERMLVLLHTILIALFASSLMKSVFQCQSERGEGGAAKYLVAGVLQPMLKLLMLTWFIKLVFQRGIKQRYDFMSRLSKAAHVVALCILIGTGGMAFLGLMYGPPLDDGCAEWLLRQPDAWQIGYLFANWAFGEIIMAYVFFLLTQWLCSSACGGGPLYGPPVTASTASPQQQANV